jgi:hypothetical protein
LRGGAPVVLHLEGKDMKGWGTLIEGRQDVLAALAEYVNELPRVPRRYRDLEQAVQSRVVIHVKLARSAGDVDQNPDG